MMKKLISLLLLVLCMISGVKAQDNKDVLVIDVSEMNEAEILSVLSFQGLANRKRPQVFVRVKGRNMWGMGWKNWYNNIGTGAIPNEIFEKYEGTEDVFIEYYTKTFGFNFKDVTFEEALQILRDVYKGVIVYTNTTSISPAGISIALTAAGVEEGIPVTKKVKDTFPYLSTLPEVKNFHIKFDDKYHAYDFSVAEYKDKVSKDFLHSYDLSNDGHFSVDYAVQQKMYTSDLSFASPIAVSGDPGGAAVNTKDTEKLNMICQTIGYKKSAYIWGWAPPTEYALIRRAGELDMVVLCNNQPNASFHAAVKISDTSIKQKRQISADDVILKNKVYVAFESNEGDTYKCLGGLMNEGTWLQTKKNQVKMNWGVNPLIFQLMPGLARYYYDTMTDQDYFFNATAGIGYVDAGLMSREGREAMAILNKSTSEWCDTHHIDIWWYRASDWVAKMGLKGQQSFEQYQSVTYPKVEGHVPIINYDISYDLTSETYRKRPENLAKYMMDMGNNPSIADGPWFQIIYAADPAMAYETMQILEQECPGRFEAVCLDEMFLLAEKAKNLIDGKKVARNSKLYNQLIQDNKEYYSFIDMDFDLPSGLIDRTFPENLEIREVNGNLVVTKKNSDKDWGFCSYNLNYDFDKYPYLKLRILEQTENPPFFLKLAEKELQLNMATKDPQDPQVYYWDLKQITNLSGLKDNIQLQVHLDKPKVGDQLRLDYIRSATSAPSAGSSSVTSDSSIRISVSDKILSIYGASSEAGFIIYNTNGKKYIESNKTKIDMRNALAGIYMLKISTGETKKFILQ